MAAAVSKLMRNQDLILAASKCRVVTRFRNTLGLPGRLSVRLQPNHPTDDLAGIAASITDGLLYGCGDACIGINPATDSLAATRRLLDLTAELIERYEIPTQSCVLAHVTTHDQGDRVGRAGGPGVPVDRRHAEGQRSLRRLAGPAGRGARSRPVARSAAPSTARAPPT